jgi:hypothetical protein
VVEAETVGPAQLARVNLDEPGSGASAGTLVELKDSQGKVMEALLLGRKHAREAGEGSRAVVAAEPDGRYILLPKDPRNVFLISDALAGLEPGPESWVNRDFFKVEKAKSVSLSFTNPANSWKIFHDGETSPWVLAGAKAGEALDGKRASMITNALAMPRFADVNPAAAAGTAVAGLDKPALLAIETFDHFVYTIKISPKGPDDNYRVMVEVAADIPAGDKTGRLRDKLKQERALATWVYTVNPWILDPVMRARAQILEGYQDDKTPDAASDAASAGKPKPAWTPRVIQ